MMDKMKALGAGGAGRALSLMEEFKAFAFKGNLIDMAVGFVLGAAFGALVKSMVDNLVMPIIGAIPLGDGGYKTWVVHLGRSPIPIGILLADLLSFVITAFALFIIFKKVLGLIVKAKAEAPPPPTKDQELLMEIRDLLKAQASKPS
jgi:large conductance mechanosensitive channel